MRARLKIAQVAWLGLALWTAPLTARAEAATPAERWTRIQQLDQAVKTGPQTSLPLGEQVRGYVAARRELHEERLKFHRDFPAAPEHWENAAALISSVTDFVREIGPDVDTKGWFAVRHDRDAVLEWNSRAEEILQEILATPEVSAEFRDRVEGECLAAQINRSLRSFFFVKTAFDAPYWERRLMDYARRHPDSPAIENAFSSLMYLADDQDAASAETFFRHFTDSPNENIRRWASGRLRLVEARKVPLELRFTAIDGREVDLAQMRGKVVLIDFWATWCPPCVEELPQMLDLYRRYRDQGFEVIGISLDGPNNIAKPAPDTPHRARLESFLAKQQVPWPQHYDGRGRSNELAVRFGVQSIPVQVLIDRTGRVVSTMARGEKLESELKRLLML